MNFTFNKIFGAVLTAVIVAFAVLELSHVLVHPKQLAEPAFKVEVAEDGAAAEAEEVEVISLAALLAGADAAKGAKVAKKCASCHSFDEGGKTKTGPNLYGILGRNIGGVDGFGYSGVMAGRSAEVWSFEALDAFIDNPKGFMKGTKMNFKGISKPEQRASLLLWLNSMSGAPVALPTE